MSERPAEPAAPRAPTQRFGRSQPRTQDRQRQAVAGRERAGMATGDTDALVVGALWRGTDILRAVTLGYAALTAFHHGPAMVHPWVAVVVLAVLGVWTLTMIVSGRRDVRSLSVELALAVAAILATRLADSSAVIEAGGQTIPSMWPAAVVVSWAVLKGWRGGVLAALVVGLADVVEVINVNDNTVYNIVLLLLVGGCVGYCADLARVGHDALNEAVRLRAQTAERERLARTVHDGVLQTLSYIHRRGKELGEAGSELGAMAADQERLLRELISETARTDGSEAGRGDARVDVRTALGRFSDGRVHLVSPADPVPLGRHSADELTAAVHEALHNVRQHAGPQASAWVLVEDEGHDVVVTVRDDGVGVTRSRLDEAMAEGRMGVCGSIQGRLRDLGGSAAYDFDSTVGTTLTLRVPRRPAP